MITIGIDPDTKDTGIALVEDGEVLRVGVASARGSIENRLLRMAGRIEWVTQCEMGPIVPDRAVIENQNIRPTDKRPNDILKLAIVVGQAMGACCGVKTYIPLPVQWKGSVPKAIHQKRILRQANLTADLKGVPGTDGMTDTQKGHVIDAIGLALWGERQR